MKKHLLCALTALTASLGAFAQETFDPTDLQSLDGKYLRFTNKKGSLIMFHNGTGVQAKVTPGELESIWYATYNTETETLNFQACDGTDRYIAHCPNDIDRQWSTVEEKDAANFGNFKILAWNDYYIIGPTHYMNGNQTSFSTPPANATAAARFYFHSNYGATLNTSANYNVVRWNAADATAWSISLMPENDDDIKNLVKNNYHYTSLTLSGQEVNQIVETTVNNVDLTACSGNTYSYILAAVKHALFVAESSNSPFANKWVTLVGGKTAHGRAKAMYYDAATNQLMWGNTQENLKFLWKIIPVENTLGQYYMINAESLVYPENATKGTTAILGTTEPTIVTFTSYNDGTHNDNAVHIRVQGASSDLHCFGHASGSSTNTYGSYICTYNDNWGSASAWYIEPATDEDVVTRYRNAFGEFRKVYYPESVQQAFANTEATPQQLESAWTEVLAYNKAKAAAGDAPGSPDEKPALVTRYRQITSVDEIKDGMQIIVRHVDNQAAGSDLYFTQTTHNDRPAVRFFRPDQIEDVNSIIWNVERDETHTLNNASISFFLKSADGKYFNAEHTGGNVAAAFYESNVYNYVLGTYLLDAPHTGGRSSLAISTTTNANLSDCGTIFHINANTKTDNYTGYGTKLGMSYLSRDGGIGKLCAGTGGNYYSSDATYGATTSYFILYAVEHEQAFYNDRIAPAAALQYYTIGQQPGQLCDPALTGKENVISNVVDNYNTYDESALLDALYEFNGVDAAAFEAIAPVDADRYIRIIGNTETPGYFTTGTGSDNTFQTEFTDNSILYYHNRRLISYSQGVAIKSTGTNSGFLRNRTTAAEHTSDNVGSVIDIVKAPVSAANPAETTGRFFVYYENQSRTMFNGEGSNNRGGSYNPNSIDGAGKQTSTDGVNKYYAFKVEYIDALPVQIHHDGIGSLYCGMNVRVPEEAGYTVFVASINEYTQDDIVQQDLQTSPVNAGTVIPAMTPILIQGEAGTIVNIPVTTDEATYNVTAHDKFKSHFLAKNVTPDADHVLVVKKDVTETDAQTMNVRRRADSEATTPLLLHVVADDEAIPAGSVALMIHQDNTKLSNGVFTASLGGSTSTTGIEEISSDEQAGETVVYDLQGRRLAAPVKGVNIINGRKFLLR